MKDKDKIIKAFKEQSDIELNDLGDWSEINSLQCEIFTLLLH